MVSVKNTNPDHRAIYARLARPNIPGVEFVLNTNFDRLAASLRRDTSSVCRQSFPTEKGEITLQSATTRKHRNRDRFIEILGNYGKPDQDAVKTDTRAIVMIRFAVEVLSLAPERIEVRAECYQAVIEPYFQDLLRRIAQRWPEADAALSCYAANALQEAAANPVSASSPATTDAKQPSRKRRGGRPAYSANKWAYKEIHARGREPHDVYPEWEQQLRAEIGDEKFDELVDPKDSFAQAIKLKKH